MNRKFFLASILLAGLSLVAFAALVMAQENVPGGDIDPAAAGSALVDAIGLKQWGLVIAQGILLVTWFLRVFVWKSLKSSWLPYVAVALGALVGFAFAMISAPDAWLAAIWAGVQNAMAAALEWNLLKPLAKKMNLVPGNK